ncbi:MAG: protein-export chaperone SecB [Rhodospirillales bacterium]|jgi:preprotein translocase subunit SecB|nr:protein-export chaperone SecB [Rhodospirillales bacterium]
MNANGTPDETAATTEENAAPTLAVVAQYVKDLSFEVPGAPAVYAAQQDSQPDITVNIDVKADPVEGDMYEVVLTIHAQCDVKETAAFVCELSYGGLFTVTGPQETLQPILLIECPRLLFPFARNIVADATRDGGFPPLMLAPVDFVGMFQNQLAQQAAAAQAEEA